MATDELQDANRACEFWRVDAFRTDHSNNVDRCELKVSVGDARRCNSQSQATHGQLSFPWDVNTPTHKLLDAWLPTTFVSGQHYTLLVKHVVTSDSDEHFRVYWDGVQVTEDDQYGEFDTFSVPTAWLPSNGRQGVLYTAYAGMYMEYEDATTQLFIEHQIPRFHWGPTPTMLFTEYSRDPHGPPPPPSIQCGTWGVGDASNCGTTNPSAPTCTSRYYVHSTLYGYFYCELDDSGACVSGMTTQCRLLSSSSAPEDRSSATTTLPPISDSTGLSAAYPPAGPPPLPPGTFLFEQPVPNAVM